MNDLESVEGSFDKVEDLSKSAGNDISSLKDDFKDLHDRFEIKFDLLKELSENQINSVKHEATDIKNIWQSKRTLDS